MADLDTADASTVQCNYCGEPFEVEDDYDEDNHPTQHVVVPVQCDKGCFCSEAHRSQAMYEAQDEQGRRALRRYYLGAVLINETSNMGVKITQEWGIDYDPFRADEVALALSPDGGTRGKEGVEDDCDALLLPHDARKIIWNGLEEIACARKKLAEVETALKALKGLRGVMG